MPARNCEANPSRHGLGRRRGSGPPTPLDALDRRHKLPLCPPNRLRRLGLPLDPALLGSPVWVKLGCLVFEQMPRLGEGGEELAVAPKHVSACRGGGIPSNEAADASSLDATSGAIPNGNANPLRFLLRLQQTVSAACTQVSYS